MKLAVKWCESKSSDALTLLVSEDLSVRLDGLCLEAKRTRRADLATWIVGVREALPSVMEALCLCALDSLMDLVTSAKSHIPTWGHLITADSYSKDLVRRVVVNAKYVKEIETEAKSLHASLYELGQVSGAWDVTQLLHGNEEWQSARKLAGDICSKAKEFLAIRACAHTVQVKTGSEQIGVAKSLLTQANLPASMQRALQSCVSQRGGAASIGILHAAKRKQYNALDVGAAVGADSTSGVVVLDREARPKQRFTR